MVSSAVLIRRVAERFAAAKDPSRERGNGRFMHSKWSRLCKLCGHPVGQHAGEKEAGLRPCFHGDSYSDHCSCPVFTPTKEFLPDDEYDRYSDGKFTTQELKDLRAKGTKTESELEAMYDKLTKR